MSECLGHGSAANDKELSPCQSKNDAMEVEVAKSDDDEEVVIINDQHPVVEIDDSDDESNDNRAFLSAPKILKIQRDDGDDDSEYQPPNHERTRRTSHENYQKLDKASRIPIYRETVERLCKYFGIDFKPEWSLSQIRKIFNERTRMHKQTPELLSAIDKNRNAHRWCRGLYAVNFPEWFEIYHLIVLMRMMSNFNVNNPTYFIKETQTGFEIKFLNIEDCRQVFYAMQGIKCFKNEIVVRVDFGFNYKKYKKQRSMKAINRIKLFRYEQTMWCPKNGGIEMHDTDVDPAVSYTFPTLNDIQNEFKRRYGDEKVPFEKEAQENLMAGSENTQNVAMPSINNVGVPSTKNMAVPSTNNVVEPITKNVAEPGTNNIAVSIINDQTPVIDIDDSDDESNDSQAHSAPKVLENQCNDPDYQPPKRQRKRRNKFVYDEYPTLDKAQRIPIYREIVERLCEYFGIDFEPEWSLSKIRQIFIERTRMHKNTPELRNAIYKNAQRRCRGLHALNFPDWFEIYHLITLMRMMSNFNVNKPTYFIEEIPDGQRIDENLVAFKIKFLNIEDCRQVFYAMQGIRCFNNKIVVKIDPGTNYKKYKEARSKNIISRMILFRRQQTMWCQQCGGTEMHDSDVEPADSYTFPTTNDIQKQFKKLYGDEKVPFEKEAQENSTAGSENTKNVAMPNTKNMALPNTKNVAVPRTNYVVMPNTKNMAEPRTNNVAVPDTNNVALQNTKPTPHSNNEKQNVECKSEKEVDITCRTILMENIPNSWKRLWIYNFIKNAAGQGIRFNFRLVRSNIDNTCNYLVTLPTHEDAMKVCNDLNGTNVPNGKRIEVKLNSDYDIGEDGIPFKRKLVSDTPSTNNQPPQKKSRPEIVPTTSTSVEACRSSLVQNIVRTPNSIQNRLTKEPEDTVMVQAALLYEDPPQSNSNNNPKSVSNTPNLRSLIAGLNKKRLEQPSVVNVVQPETSDFIKINTEPCNSNKPSRSVVRNLENTAIQEIPARVNELQENNDINRHTSEDTLIKYRDKAPVIRRKIETEIEDVNIKKEPGQADIQKGLENSNLVMKKETNVMDCQATTPQNTRCTEKSDLLLFKYLPPSVSCEALASKLGELGELLFCELTGTNRAVVRFRDPRDAERCQRIFHHSRVDGRVIEVVLA